MPRCLRSFSLSSIRCCGCCTSFGRHLPGKGVLRHSPADPSGSRGSEWGRTWCTDSSCSRSRTAVDVEGWLAVRVSDGLPVHLVPWPTSRRPLRTARCRGTRLAAVWGRWVSAPEPVVECHGRGQSEEATDDACHQPAQGPGAVALEGEDLSGQPPPATCSAVTRGIDDMPPWTPVECGDASAFAILGAVG